LSLKKEIKKLKNELFEKQILHEEEVNKNDERFQELREMLMASQKKETELRNQNFQKEEIIGNLEQEIKSLKTNLSNVVYKHDVILKESKEKNEEIQSVHREINILREDLSKKEKMTEDFSRLIAVHDKCKRRFDEFESTIKDMSETKINYTNEKNYMISSIRNIVYNRIHHEIPFQDSEEDFQNFDSHSFKKRGCQTSGCDGSGHKDGKTKSHRV
jgi:HPt (histidine-containing phosphotransfer) domain-containing protein